MARPKKAIKRQKRIRIGYTIAEYKLIQKYADFHGLTTSEFIRSKSFNHKLKPRVTPQEADLYRKLTGMANNLNQLAKVTNRENGFTSQVLEALKSINTLIDNLR